MSTSSARGRLLLGRSVSFFLMAMACAGRLAAQSGSVEVLHSFSGPPNGLNPESPLILGSDGNFYGATANGGASNKGSIFKITPAGALTTIYSFPGGAGGANPQAALTQGSDGNFYGVTYAGGNSKGDGTIFKITPAGVLTTLYTFTGGADGGEPDGALTQGKDGNFYGTTFFGTVFKITPAGVLTTVYSFAANDTSIYSPMFPSGGLTLGSDGNFYGVTESGGSGYYGPGTVFKITPAGALTILYQFSGDADGSTPAATLTLGSDGNFYGTTERGGTGYYGPGTIFKMTPAGVLTTLYQFPYGSLQGTAGPSGLTEGTDGNFYGTTEANGSRALGSVFQITPAGVLTTIYSFLGHSDGLTPAGGVTLGKDGNFYGTTYGSPGQAQSDGTVFKVTPAGVLSDLYTFTGSIGTQVAALTQGSDGNLYGTTPGGDGNSSNGTAYKITPAGVYSEIYAFTGANGANPRAGLLQGATSGVFYGDTCQGGHFGIGTIFQITSAGVLTNLYTFTGGADGSEPAGNLIQDSAGNFYGTAINNYGGSGAGSIFKLTPAGVLTTLYNFTGYTDGAHPINGLVKGNDGNFYGTSQPGSGLDGAGAAFKITPAGAFTTLYTFSLSSNGVDPNGIYPNSIVLGRDGNFYGTTQQGGANYYGTIFKMTPAGVLTTLYSFPANTSTLTGLTLANDGNFYGTTVSPNDSIGYGSIFKITPAGVLTTVHTFTGGAGGSDPEASLTQGSDGNLYGTTNGGGQYGLGAVFRLLLAKPIVTSAQASAEVNAAFSYQIAATSGPTSYAASNLPPGLNINDVTGLISGTPTKIGTFAIGLTATNSIGAGTGTLSLTVNPQPPVVTSATETAKFDSAFSFQIAATNSPTSYGATNLPTGLTINTAKGLISGSATQSGRFPVGLSATNAGGTGTGMLALTVNPPIPVINSALTASGTAGQAFSYQITASNNPTSFGATNLPTGLTVNATTGLISGTPTRTGTFAAGLSATNAGGKGYATLELTISPAAPTD